MQTALKLKKPAKRVVARRPIPKAPAKAAAKGFPGSNKSRALTAEEVEAFGLELDALQREIMSSLGESEATYIRRVRDAVRYTEIGGRALLMAGWFPPAWLLGT